MGGRKVRNDTTSFSRRKASSVVRGLRGERVVLAKKSRPFFPFFPSLHSFLPAISRSRVASSPLFLFPSPHSAHNHCKDPLPITGSGAGRQERAASDYGRRDLGFRGSGLFTVIRYKY